MCEKCWKCKHFVIEEFVFLTKAANRAMRHWNITATKETSILYLLVARGVTVLRKTYERLDG